MKWSWFDLAWPWIGLGIGVILFVFLFATQTLRGTTVGSRWRDPVWLAWLIHGLIGDTTFILIQIVNPIWFFLVPWLASRNSPEAHWSA